MSRLSSKRWLHHTPTLGRITLTPCRPRPLDLALRPRRNTLIMTPVKVTEQLIEKTKALRMKGKTQEAIAIELGITQGTVSRILRNNGLGGHLISRIRK